MDEPAPAADARRWFVVQSQPRRELYAAGHLANQGYETFVPRIGRVVRHARKTQTVQRPLFARYLFVALDLSVDYWRPIRGTFGVSGLIMEGERPQPVPRGVVEALIAASDGAGGFDYADQLRVGQRVRFLAGAFADRIGALVSLDEAGRVGVLMEILGAERVVAAAPTNLAPVAP